MGNSKKRPAHNKTSKVKTNLIVLGALIVFVSAFYMLRGGADSDGQKDSQPNTEAAQQNGDVTIVKDEITENAKFIPYMADGTYMELLAVKAPDGTVRTAFNTCQVCYDSGKGYYEQEGDELVCQNCRNRFQLSRIEKEKNGCNPVPIVEEDKTDDGTTITIPESFLKENAALFGRWEKG